MISSENPDLSVMNLGTDIVEHTGLLPPPPPTVTIVSDLTNFTTRLHTYEHCPRFTAKRASFKQISIGAISRQLTVRKFIQHRLGLISKIMCFFGLLGIILMIIENEITFLSLYNQDTNISWFIKLLITISTVILVSLVIYYHYLNLNLYATQNSFEHWRVGLTFKRILFIIFEILICAIHPMSREFPRHWISKHEEIKSNITTFDISVSPSYIAIDVALGLPMFLRLYLIFRCIMFHSHLVRDAPFKSFGSLNRVSIDFTFLMKTFLEQWPARSLIIFCFCVLFIGSWSMRACDYQPTVAKHISMLDSMWLFIITFTTVGYGDMTPSTYCGRSIAAIVALFGLLSSALLISVVAQKLHLTRCEKYVHNFVSEIELTRKSRIHAANVIKFAIKTWYLRRKNRHRSLQYISARRMLFRSTQSLRKIKRDQRRMNDNCLGTVELMNIQRYTSTKTKRIAMEVSTMKLSMDKLEQKFTDINKTINNIQSTLQLLVDKLEK